jgi:FKBP-type peptidyl-prolyl cis-trans isomerase FkpA
MKLTIYRVYAVLALFLVVFAGCETEVGTIEQLDQDNITNYIKQNNIDVQQYGTTGIYYKILIPGTGSVLTNESDVALVYTLKTIDGKYTAIDTVYINRFANFAGYITPAGLRTGVVDILKKGNGQIRLIIPSKQGFGRNGAGGVSGNASLDVTVRAIDPKSLPVYEDGLIKQFFTANNLTGFTKTDTGIYYKITTVGTGAAVTSDSQVTVAYTGKLLDGRLFDSSTAATFYLDDLVPAWKQIIPLAKVGSVVRMIVPSSQAYGFAGSGTIPPFGTLDFEVTITSRPR